MKAAHGKNLIKGFSLLELSVVLLIIGAIVGGGIAVGSAQLEAARETQTRQKMAAIEEAMLTYRRLNKRLPCPNTYYAVPGDLNYGSETDDNGFGSGTCYGATSVLTAGYTRGVVPAKTLGLPIGFMVDGWGNKFTYVVSLDYTAINAFTNFPISTVASVLSIKDLSENFVITDEVIYVLMSHGKNGSGAPMINGDFHASSGNTQESINASSGGGYTYFYAGPLKDSSQAHLYFDDIVTYKTRMQLPGNDE